ncbi:MAG: NAD(P)H-dependent oxidoreductase [Candidatus Babeliales bacterium]
MKKSILILVAVAAASTACLVTYISARTPRIGILLGSTRNDRSSAKVGAALLKIMRPNKKITAEIIDLRDFNIPFFADATPPATRTVITDPIIQKWSDAIAHYDGFIIVVPEYNSSFPGVLKNALDSLYVEWNKKPVAFVGYAGGPNGGATAVAHLTVVAKGLQMVPVATTITIPSVWKAFNADGTFIDTTIASQVQHMSDQLVSIYSSVVRTVINTIKQKAIATYLKCKHARYKKIA